MAIEGVTSDKIEDLGREIAGYVQEVFDALIDHYAATNDAGRAEAEHTLRAVQGADARAKAQRAELKGLQADAQAASGDLVSWLRIVSRPGAV